MLAAAWVTLFLGAYVPDLGRGFVQDDFAWVLAARDAISRPGSLIAPPSPGFFRPVVTLTFMADYGAHGLDPRGYGFTNLVLLLSCMAAFVALCRELRLPWLAAILAAFIWSINPHGVGMALLWLSGRTALCLTLFALLSQTAMLKGYRMLAATFLFAALLSKEEAVAFPVVLLTWRFLFRRDAWREGRGILLDVLAVAVPLAAYAVLRMRTQAFTPATAPSFYRFTADPLLITRNALEYFDRGATLAATIVLLAMLVTSCRPRVTALEKRFLIGSAVWFCTGYALTLWLPVRSSLYAVCPSIGSALASALLVASCCREAAPVRTPRLAWALAAVVFAIPIYRIRDVPYVEAARVSHRMIDTIVGQLNRLPAHGVIILEDESDTKSNFANAFGNLGSEAVRLYTGRSLAVRIVAGRGRGSGADPVEYREDVAARFRLVGGRIEPR